MRVLMLGLLCLVPSVAWGQEVVPDFGSALEGAVQASNPETTSDVVRLIVMLTALAFLPGVLLVMTPFTRFIIVLSLMRQALGLQQSPPNQVLIGLSLVLSMVVMQPTLEEVKAPFVVSGRRCPSIAQGETARSSEVSIKKTRQRWRVFSKCVGQRP